MGPRFWGAHRNSNNAAVKNGKKTLGLGRRKSMSE
jgi:hypothetical protein